jgi:hypothetical protein
VTAAVAPGVVLVWSGTAAHLAARRIEGDGIVLGRDLLGELGVAGDDDRISRAHARVRRVVDGFAVADAGSRNGTFVDGQAIAAHALGVVGGSIVRTGRTLWWLVDDVRPYLAGDGIVVDDGIVIGPSTRPVWQRLDELAAGTASVVLLGPVGTGRDTMAARFAARSGAVRVSGVDPCRHVDATGERIVATAHVLRDDVGVTVVEVPALDDRADEVAAIIARTAAAARPDVRVHASVVEAVLCDDWFDGIAGLIDDTKRAMPRARDGVVRAEDLRADRRFDPSHCVVPDRAPIAQRRHARWRPATKT